MWSVWGKRTKVAGQGIEAAGLPRSAEEQQNVQL